MTSPEKDISTVTVLLLISTHCAHCSAALQALTAMVKQGDITRLEIVNLEQDPDLGEKMGVRSVPWMRIGEFVFEGAQTPGEIKHWVRQAGSKSGEKKYLEELLISGGVNEVIQYIRNNPDAIKVVASLMADADAKINLKLGIGVVFEEFATDPVVEHALPLLKHYLKDDDARIRGDACHYLSLTGDKTYIPLLEACLEDDSEDVREIAQDGLDVLHAS